MFVRACFVFLFSSLVMGCQTLQYEAELSSVNLSNMAVSEYADNKTGKHEIVVSFDYAFTQNFAHPDLYFCTVQFLGKEEGASLSSNKEGFDACRLTQASGKVSFSWPSPLDGITQDAEKIKKLRLPVQYFVAVHQKTAKNTSIVIAHSQTFQSTK